jgi:hypothetical protein
MCRGSRLSVRTYISQARGINTIGDLVRGVRGHDESAQPGQIVPGESYSETSEMGLSLAAHEE